MRYLLIITATLLTLLTAGVATAQEDTTRHTADNLYGDTYTPEELAAIDQALWAANMTRTDMTYKKDLTEGHGCFPIVKTMMHDPLRIATWMDRIAEFYPTGLASTSTSASIFLTDSSGMSDTLYAGDYNATPHLDQDWLDSLDSLLSIVDELFAERPRDMLTDQEKLDLRAEITTALAWHDIEETATESGYNESKSTDTEDLYALADKTYPFTMARGSLYHWCGLAGDLSVKGSQIDWPVDEPLIINSENGRICIGTPGDDIYQGDFAVLIEPGGDDHYVNCRIGAAYGKSTPELGDGWLGFFVDLEGDDLYECSDVSISLGAAVMGIGAFYDLGGGDDRYFAGSCTLGAAMGGVATFYDDGGSDYYSGKVYTMGAAGFGIGLMVDDSVADAPEFDTAEGNDGAIDNYETGESEVNTHGLMDNDYYTAWANSQAFARPRGIALCINKRGNETYHAGGVYLHAPLFADRYQSFSQGFAIGERGIDWAGGIAMLIDYDGNDRYLGDIYNQGVGYWYGAGLLWDGGGNDTYEMTQYGQGSGIHLAIGGLVDVSGSDAYLMHSGLGQGSSHDLAASILHDRGGNDRYHGNTTCNGGSLTGSVSMCIDRSGDDTYAGRPGNSINYADNRRINIGLLIDTGGGDDEYMGVMDDDTVWRQGNIGLGADVAPPPETEVTPGAGGTSEPNQLSAPADQIPIPEICSYEGELTQEVFDELWEIAVRWEVGDNRVIVPHARDRLVAFGAAVVHYMSAVMDESNSGLALRAYVDIFRELLETDAEAIYACLEENAASGDAERQKTVLYLISELKIIELEHVVTGFFEQDDASLMRRAIGVLGALGSHSADENLIDMLTTAKHDELPLTAVLNTLTNLGVDCYEDLRWILGHELVSVRVQLVKQLAGQWDTYGDDVLADLAAGDYGTRELRSLLDVLARVEEVPEDAALMALMPELLAADDWGVRADAVRVVKRWKKLMSEGHLVRPDVVELIGVMEDLLETETAPYVLFVAEEE